MITSNKRYALIIVLACLLLYICTIGLNVTSLSVYFPYIKADYGLSNTQVSLINTIRNASAAFFMPLMRLYYKRFSLRIGMTLSLLILAVSFLLLSVAHGLAMMYIAAVSMGLSFASGTNLPITLLLHNWFTDHISVAFGIITAGSGLASFVASPIIADFIHRSGLAGTFRREALFIVFCAVVFCAAVRVNPKEAAASVQSRVASVRGKGISDPARSRVALVRKKGRSEPVRSRVAPVRKKDAEEVGPNRSRIPGIRMSDNLLIFGMASFLVGTFSSICITSYTIHFTIAGYGAIAVAAFMSIYGLSLIPSKITYGILADKFSAGKINIIYFGLFLIGIVCVLLQGKLILFLPLLYFSAACIGLGNGITTAGMAVWANDLSAVEKLERNVRVSQTFFSVGLIAGSTITGILADITGDYTVSFVSVIIMNIMAYLFITYLYKRGTVD